MIETMLYTKKQHQPMYAWTEETDMTNISISNEDGANGSPKKGDMIAVNVRNPKDKWLVAKDFFEANYVAVTADGGKTLGNTDTNGARKNVKDIVFWGNGDTFKLISKASSQAEGWMKSTKAMDVNNGVVVQVTTQQRNSDGSYVVAEALTFVPGAAIYENKDEDGNVISRSVWTADEI